MSQMEREVVLDIGGGTQLYGTLAVPAGARGLVMFAHGSGSSRMSPRNRYVAERLQQVGLATLLIDLLTAAEEAEDRLSGHLRFDIELLAGRLRAAARWLEAPEATRALRLGLFGASTGAAAALITAAREPDRVFAVVSRGGRPDLALAELGQVCAPTLLIVGGADPVVIEMNREAERELRTLRRLEIVPGAGHLFEEPGALDRVADLASDWFLRYLVEERPTAPVVHP